ncbi:16S rRNA (adenine(1518)-N(6)/adenine(1519)-N(6))-dimethyltransferase RsmA [Francisella frigiditurris]|uniref:Ribosomal RNA small subunit methyltransferase A n=1 Tax=Francisella frigiditurris TaxID=1542390 RepID=A0A1J0KWD7_9GAMM|nr:16S rRNA (adenine(1518)-N(6)/adenine(1519)-N(6))-dimethyltransferase RsmA [Francisella frigiditurris]APC97994.1 ribosomal RNA small subunit methyltransferase A [Francisella frigiditurris]
MQYKTKAKKSLGQNFLQDENIITKIIKITNISKDDIVFEIGPGLGALTRHLLTKTKNVNVIEFDSEIIPTLIENCLPYGNINIFNEDVLDFNISKFPNNKIKLIGNLPYNISTPILFKIISFTDKIIDAHFMLQKEVVDRITAQPNNKSYGRLSVILQYHFRCSSVMHIPPEVFYPKPKVDSSILKLIPINTPLALNNYKLFSSIVKQSFSQRRKTLLNNLKPIFKEKNIDLSKIPVDTQLRAENLSVEDFVKLSNFLSQ